MALPLTALLLVFLSASSGAQSGGASTCGTDLGTLSGSTGSAQVSGTIAADASCTSPQRDPDDSESLYYARRHTFTLDAAATVSVWVSSSGDSSVSTYMLLIGGSSADGSGTVLARVGVSNWLLAAGTYTVEATTGVAGHTGTYTLGVSWAPADACVRDLGTLDGTTMSASRSGIVAVDPDCTSSLRDPGDSESVYYARRHTFTLAEAATVSVEVGPSSSEAFLILSDGSGAEVSRAQGRSARRSSAPARLDHLLLGAGTYTVEASKTDAGRTGAYWVHVDWAAADACVRDLGALGGASPSVSGSGIVAVDASCISPSRAGDSTDVYYARRHTFALAEAATVSVQMTAVSVPGQRTSLQPQVTLIEGASSGGSGTVVRAGSPWSGYVVLDAGTYTVEASSHGAGQTGPYSVQVDWAPVDDCVRDLGTLSASAATLSGSGIVAVDASCTSPSRAGDGTEIYYARRHTFTLTAPAAVSAQVTPPGAAWYGAVIAGASSDGSGTVVSSGQGRNRFCPGRWPWNRYCHPARPAGPGYLLLDAGTYTIEATAYDADATGVYEVQVDWAPVDDCVRDLGTLSASAARLTGSGTIAKDAECISPSRAGDSAEVHYVRRHTFTLDSAATVSVEVGPPGGWSFVSLVAGDDPGGAGTQLGTASGRWGYRPLLSLWRPIRPARLVDVLLRAGTYTVEASKLDIGDTGPYSVSVEWGPSWRDVTVTDAAATESDGVVVLAVEAALPDSAVSEVVPAHVSWSTAPDTAVESSDFVRSSSTATIPADGSRATLTVPLVDDTLAEGTESFSVRLGSSGAVLRRDIATATITDDDPAPSSPVPSASVCTGGTVSGVVGDVFDVVQSGYAEWTDVFVDVELSCDGGSAGSGGYRTGMEVLYGAAAPRASSWCVRGGISPVTVPTMPGCAARVTEAVLLSTRAVTTHIVRIPDTAVGEAHQLRVWIDLDKDGERDADEESHIFPTDFSSRAQNASGGGARFALAEDFEIARLSRGSDRIGRAGHWAIQRLLVETPTGQFAYDPVLSSVVPVRVPLANAQMGAFVYAGPSSTADVMCLVTPVVGLVSPGYSDRCVTDTDGTLTLRYRVQAPPVTATGPQQDDLWIWWDRNSDGAYDPGTNRPELREPSDTIAMPIAKAAVNYVALGDSYSAGEAGDSPSSGSYQSGLGAADADCKRWDQAFPYVFNRHFLGNPEPTGTAGDLFRTFACVGAITLNVHDSSAPSETDTFGSNRPSHHAPERTSSLTPPTGWEPRQAESLRAVRGAWLESMREVDMVTITISGNDAGFAGVLRECVLGGRDCRPAHLSSEYSDIPARLSSLLDELKRVAPNASIFVLGYPHITPRPVEANRAVIERCGQPGYPLYLAGIRANAISGWAHFVLLGSESDAGISFSEAEFLWAVATDLNQKLQTAASEAGVHFVDISGGHAAQGASKGFAGHSPCSHERWVNGFLSRANHFPPAHDHSLHPNAAGHTAYARLLVLYLQSQTDSGVRLNEAGIPVNPGSEER